MLNINANGNGSDFENGLAAGSNAAVNEFEKGVCEAFRGFLKEVRKLYGENVFYHCNTNGTFDFGGGNLNVNLTLTNYPEPSPTVGTASSTIQLEPNPGPQTVIPETAFSSTIPAPKDGAKLEGDI